MRIEFIYNEESIDDPLHVFSESLRTEGTSGFCDLDFILFLLASDFPTFADPFQFHIEAPVNCAHGASCGRDVKLDDAVVSAIDFKKYLANCHQKHQFDDFECRLNAVVDHNICGEPIRYYYDWVAIEDTANSNKAMQFISSHLSDGTPFNSHVLIAAADSPLGEQHIALCSVSVVAGQSGPPENCTTVAVVRGTSVFVRAGKETRMCFLSASIRVDTGVIDINYEVENSANIEALADALKTMMDEKLKLSVELETRRDKEGKPYSVFLRSTAPLRDSPILGGGWRESFAFDLSVDFDSNSIKVEGSSEPMICRTASGSLEDYQIPNDAQRGTYARALDGLVGAALMSACSGAVKMDASHIACGK